MDSLYPQRRKLPHDIPLWVSSEAVYFVTLCVRDRGAMVLTVMETSVKVLESIRSYHSLGRWFVHLVLLMPDHLHMLVSFPPESLMVKTLSSWKSYTAKCGGFLWQRDFFEHRLRHDESMDEKWNYILENPVRKGICQKPEDWPHIWKPK